jgi:hypothetical protein
LILINRAPRVSIFSTLAVLDTEFDALYDLLMRPFSPSSSSPDCALSTADSPIDLAAILAAFPAIPARAPTPAITVTLARVASQTAVFVEGAPLRPESSAPGTVADDDAASAASDGSVYSDDDGSDTETAVDADESRHAASARAGKKTAGEEPVWWARHARPSSAHTGQKSGAAEHECWD